MMEALPVLVEVVRYAPRGFGGAVACTPLTTPCSRSHSECCVRVALDDFLLYLLGSVFVVCCLVSGLCCTSYSVMLARTHFLAILPLSV